MEDFAPLIWVLVIIGAATYGSFSQARKKAGENHKKHGHGEAWPSWDMSSAPEHESEDQSHEFDELQKEQIPESAPRAREIHREERQHHPSHGQYTELGPKTKAYAHEFPTTKVKYPTYAHTAETDVYAIEEVHAANTGVHTASKQAPDAFTETSDEAPEVHTDEEFDVRKAVIYAEILKPKYDE